MMKARDIQNRLYLTRRSTYAVMLPNYTPRDWHECDLFAITRSGYFHEFEIKLTKSDFLADAKKRMAIRKNPLASGWMPNNQTKHELLSLADERGPSKFHYVVPGDLVEVIEVPEWAGLVVAGRSLYAERDVVRMKFVKDAPRLHTRKVSRVVLRHSINVCYYRFWDERRELDRIRKEMAQQSAA